jgi:hypothetical protein
VLCFDGMLGMARAVSIYSSGFGENERIGIEVYMGMNCLSDTGARFKRSGAAGILSLWPLF